MLNVHTGRRSLEQLPLDLLDRILSCMPDFSSLQSAVLSGKCFNEAFKSHQKTLIEGVMHNEHSDAIKFARSVYFVETDENVSGTNDCLMQPQDNFDGPITGKEAMRLSRYEHTARRLETHFSVLWVQCWYYCHCN